MTREEFIEKAKAKHNDKYDYSKVEFDAINYKTPKIELLCPLHGSFFLTPKNHLRGSGCNKCAQLKRNKKSFQRAKESFIPKAKEIHGDKYDYSKVIYAGYFKKVEVVCPLHGSFFIRPADHIHNRQGCPICGKIHRNDWKKATNEKFLEKAREKFGEKFSFSNLNIENSRSKVEITCSNCGRKFVKIANDFLCRGKCPNCDNNHLLTKEKFTRMAEDIYGGKFDYSLIDSVNSTQKFRVICPVHGEITTDYNHFITRRQGCGLCSKKERLEDKITIPKKFLDCDYEKEYDSLINSARSQNRKKGERVYENHHIVPRSLGGNNKKSNLILLTPQEHFLAHYLLYKITNSKEMVNALWCMVVLGNRELDESSYGELRSKLI